MKERLSILVGVLLAAYVVWGVFTPRVIGNDRARPVSTEGGPKGYLGLERWLAQSGVPTRSLREPFTTLNGSGGPFVQPGHILIMSMPHLDPPNRDEMNALLDWVSEGNTLVILAGLNDTPRWTSSAITSSFGYEFAYLTSLNAKIRLAESDGGDHEAEPAAPAAPEPHQFTIEALPGNWLTDAVGEIEAISDLPTGAWDIEPDEGARAYVIARSPAEDVDALLVANLGKGALVVSTFASIWQNSMLGRRDNRRLVINLLRHHLGPGGSVVFDDYHQGLTKNYDARAFFTDPRLAWTAALMLGFWLLYAIFSESRLGRPSEAGGGSSHTDFVQTLGTFLARKVSPNDAGLRLVDNFLAHVRPHLAAGPESSIWQRVVAAPRMDAALADALRRDHEALRAGRTVDLKRLQFRISLARRAFS